jgi:hypothetical protein
MRLSDDSRIEATIRKDVVGLAPSFKNPAAGATTVSTTLGTALAALFVGCAVSFVT